MTPHPPEDLLMMYAEEPRSVPDPPALEAHLDRCRECSATVDDYRLIMVAQQQPEMWRAADQAIDPGRLEAFGDFGRRLRDEDEEARRILEPFLGTLYKFSAANITEKKRYATGGVVRLLCVAARDQVDRQPLFAIALAEAATAIAEGLPDEQYPAKAVFEYRGTAWKEYSTACRVLGRFDQAWEALDRAEAAYRRLVVSRPQLAAVSMARASILYKREHYETALPYARSAAADFAQFHDRQRYFDAKQVEATILRLMGDPMGAAAAYEAMLMQAEATRDAEMNGRAAQNLGVVYLESGNIDRAASYFSTALQIFERLELHARAARTRWSIGVVALASGRFEEAVHRLTAARAELFLFGMKSDAQLAALHLAEALVVLGRWKPVNSLCTELVVFFRASDMITGALTAASFLKEAAATRSLTRDQIGVVRQYLEALERQPALAFVPPAPG